MDGPTQGSPSYLGHVGIADLCHDVADVLEDKQREKPMAHLPAAGQWVYDGPEKRSFPG